MKELGIAAKVKTALDESGYDAVLVTGWDHTRYLSGADLPFAPYRSGQKLVVYCPKGGEPSCLCPAEWASTALKTSWIAKVDLYPASSDGFIGLAQVLSEWMKSLPAGARVGIDLNRTPNNLYDLLREMVTWVNFTGCDKWLTHLREVKTPAELDLLVEAAMLTDHGINGTIHHITVDRRTTSLTLAEELRVHTQERGIDLVGYHAASHVMVGEETRHFWSNPPKYGYSRTDDLHPLEMVRMKIQTSLNGYWSDATRILTMGEPTPEQNVVFNMLVRLREAAVAAVQPGARCSDVYRAVAEVAQNEDIPLFTPVEVGHGIGVAPCEAPYLSPCDETLLEPGMVLVLDPIVIDSCGQIWRSKDTLIVTDMGCKIVGWYKDWREPYIPIASI